MNTPLDVEMSLAKCAAMAAGWTRENWTAWELMAAATLRSHGYVSAEDVRRAANRFGRREA